MKILGTLTLAALMAGCATGGVAATSPTEDPRPARAAHALECQDAQVWAYETDVTVDAEGASSAREALETEIEPFADRLNAQPVYVSTLATASLDGRVVVQATAKQLDNGTWVVGQVRGCTVDVHASM